MKNCMVLIAGIITVVAVAVVVIWLTKVIVNSDMPLWLKIFLLR